jgi:cyclophilin family peptidyl-prolyl cis-trans isomerase
MFKQENQIYWYMVGIVFMMALLLYAAREFFIPLFLLEPVFNESTEYAWTAEPRFALDLSKDYYATIYTDQGPIVMDLFELSAPRNVNNFVFLSNQGYYDGTSFHRLVQDFLLQGGDRNTLDDDLFNDGRGGPGYFIPDEVNWDALDLSSDRRAQLSANGYSTTPGIDSRPLRQYTLAMANSLPSTNGSQFFFVIAEDEDPRLQSLQGQFTVIGQVYSGADLLARANTSGVDDSAATNPRPNLKITIDSVTIYTR